MVLYVASNIVLVSSGDSGRSGESAGSGGGGEDGPGQPALQTAPRVGTTGTCGNGETENTHAVDIFPKLFSFKKEMYLVNRLGCTSLTSTPILQRTVI